jgi:hypothetical protein
LVVRPEWPLGDRLRCGKDLKTLLFHFLTIKGGAVSRLAEVG